VRHRDSDESYESEQRPQELRREAQVLSARSPFGPLMRA
jgi:hypothetical protein